MTQQDMQYLMSVREVVKKYNINADKKLGQNFLFDQNITDKIARAAGDFKGKRILEIGPGPGCLTRSLLEKGADVTAIEMDTRCVNALTEVLLPVAAGRLHIISGDALDKRLYGNIADGTYVIANLPYNISTQLLTNWLDMKGKFSGYTLMFQKEVAARMMAKPSCKDYGRLSVKVQFSCDVEHEFDIPPEAFSPPPKVTSSVITIIPRAYAKYNADEKQLEKLCKAAFGQRRKTLRVSLRQIHDNPVELLKQAGIDDNKRPEQLDIEELCRIANILESNIN